MRVVVQGNDHTGTVVMAALVRVTVLHEARGTPGLRRLVHGLVARGECCEAAIAAAGARVQLSVAPDYVELVLAAPAESRDQCAGLMRRMLFAPRFTQEALDSERAQVMHSIAARTQLPAGYALASFYERLYPGVGAGDAASGEPAKLAAVTLEEVARFHGRHYLPNETVIAVSGGVDGAAAMDAVAAAMGSVLPGAAVQEALEPLPSAPGVTRLRGSWGTSVYVVGGRGVSLDAVTYPAAAVGFTALSSGMDSRLYRALRIERSLAYSIAGELTPSARVPSAFVLVTCDPQRLDEVVAVVDGEITRLGAEPLGASELQRAKRYLIGRHALRRQRNHEIAHYLAMFELLGGPQGYRRDGELAGEIAAVNAAEVADAMRQIFAPRWAVRLEGRQAADAG